MAATLEMPSGKGARDENFQVGSFLLPARLRPHVAAFYDFVRAADDVADHPDLPPADKLQRLHRFERALIGSADEAALLPKAVRLRASLAATGVPARHAQDLLAAFRQDATKLRYADWADLMGYCALSASPVGRFLLDLHGEERTLWRHSDPLCDALQVLNHVQDCQADYLRLDRVYLPQDAFAAAGIEVDALGRSQADAPMRLVLGRTLDGVDRLLAVAAPLPRALRSPRLAAEAAAILEMAHHLARGLRRRDPLASRVELGRARFLLAAAIGIGRAAAGRLRRRARRAPGAGPR